MGGAFCADAKNEPLPSALGISDLTTFDSLEDCLEDDGWDQGSFVSARSNKVRASKVNDRKKLQPQTVNLHPGINPLDCGQYNTNDNMVLWRKHPGSVSKPIAQKSCSLNSLGDDSKKNQSSLLVTDDDMRTQIKAIIQPYMFNQVQKIVDQAVEDLFAKVNNQNEILNDPCKRIYLSHKQARMPLKPNKADKHHMEKFENMKKDFARFDGIKMNVPKQSSDQPISEKITHGLSYFSDDSDDTDSISRLFRADDGFQSASEMSLTRVSSIKLYQVSSLGDIKQDNSEIKHNEVDLIKKSVDLNKNFGQIKTCKDYGRGQGVN